MFRVRSALSGISIRRTTQSRDAAFRMAKRNEAEMTTRDLAAVAGPSLDALRIELPSWGFANTGTRFGKFLQPAAASTIEEKLSDAGVVHALTGSCPTVALHVLWDFPRG